MATVDNLRQFQRVQPSAANGQVDAREFVEAETRIENAITSIVKFCRTAIPAGVVIPAYLTAAQVTGYFSSTGLGLANQPYEGWAICNGSNGTPNLDGKFPRFETSAAGSSGGSDTNDHTHNVDPGSFTSGAEAAHTHAARGTLYAAINMDTAALFADHVAQSFTPDTTATLASSGDATAQAAAVVVGGSTAAGSSHTHSIDVPITATGGVVGASATENRPAYYELVPVMRL